MNDIRNTTAKAVSELIKVAKLHSGAILVVGCSTSEVQGSCIGTNSNIDVAKEIYDGLQWAVADTGIYLAFQCCEHLNRAIVIEQAAVPNAEICNVVPQKKAGGSMATMAYQNLKNPVVVEFIKADAGIDIGDTFIGMHLKHVAVPVRLSVKEIGGAHVTAARVRAKFIGGERAVYDLDMAAPGEA